MNIRIKRVYELPSNKDGTRILVDRLWPRGLTKDKAKVNVWMKDIAPSKELRLWFSHDPKKWPEFQIRYVRELENNKHTVDELRAQLQSGTGTLLYGAQDELHNNAVVLQSYLEQL